jgi:hypothetical protein
MVKHLSKFNDDKKIVYGGVFFNLLFSKETLVFLIHHSSQSQRASLYLFQDGRLTTTNFGRMHHFNL